MGGVTEQLPSKRGAGSALSRLLAIAEPWESRREPASDALVQATAIASVVCLVGGLILKLAGGAIASGGSGFAHFFWIHPLGAALSDLVGWVFVIWPLAIVSGLLGLVLAAVLATKPTSAEARYGAIAVAAVAGVVCVIEVFVAAAILAQLILWVAVGVIVTALVIAVLAALASG